MTRSAVALVTALVLAVGLVVSCRALTGADPATETPSGSPTASRAPTHTPRPAAKQTPRPGTKSTPKIADRVSLAGTGSRRSKQIVLAGGYVLRDAIVTKAGCHWRVFLDGYDTAPIDEVMTNASGSTSNAVSLVGLGKRHYTVRVVASSCGRWSVSLTRT